MAISEVEKAKLIITHSAHEIAKYTTRLMVYMLCANYGSGHSLNCLAQSMDPQFAQSIYRLTRPQACHTTTSRGFPSRLMDVPP